MQNIILPNEDDILLAHEFILKMTGGRPGVRDKNVIKSAIHRPETYMQYQECTIHTICALLLDSIARNHGFVEGNKRTALMTVIMTYSFNGVHLKFSDEMNKKFEELALEVVEKKPSIEKIEKKLANLCGRFQTQNPKTFIDNLTSFFGI